MTTPQIPIERNFYTEHLPVIRSANALNSDLIVPPTWSAAERDLDATLRRTCVLRLGRYFMPGQRHLRFAEEFLMLLREGYEGRGRVLADHQRRIREFAEQHANGTLIEGVMPTACGSASPVEASSPRISMTSKALGTRNTARSAVLIGMPGMGKSLTTEEVLNGLPEMIEHRSPLVLKQVVWMKLDCPQKGSIRQLCIDFFGEMDRIIGGDSYSRQYASSRATEGSMMSHMALVANLHALGVLVIDEIQHLRTVHEENDLLLKFIVTLINKIGVPVLLIGTGAATPIVRRTMRLGRRSVGLASDNWERYSRKDDDWNLFIDDLWRYQWTRTETPLDAELREALYDETQGIVDLAVKLFMLVQLRAIRRGVAIGADERITPKLLRQVAKDEFATVRPLVEALRSGDRNRIERYGDLSPLHDRFTRVLSAEAGTGRSFKKEARFGGMAAANDAESDGCGSAGFFDQVFRQLGVAEDVGAELVRSARAKHGEDADVFTLLEAIRTRLAEGSAPKKRPARRQPVEPASDDLRAIVSAGAAEGLSGYRSLVAAGLAGPAALLRAD